MQASEKGVDGSQVLVMGASCESPHTSKAKPALLPTVLGSSDSTSRLLTLFPVQEIPKKLSDVLFIFHKYLCVLEESLTSLFPLGEPKKSLQPSIFHLRQVQRICSEFFELFLFQCFCFCYILDFSLKSQMFSLVLSLWFCNKEVDDEVRSYQTCSNQHTSMEVLVFQCTLLAKPFLSL